MNFSLVRLLGTQDEVTEMWLSWGGARAFEHWLPVTFYWTRPQLETYIVVGGRYPIKHLLTGVLTEMNMTPVSKLLCFQLETKFLEHICNNNKVASMLLE